MQVVIFYGCVSNKVWRREFESLINKFLRGIPRNDIVKLQTIPCEQDHCAVFVWLKADAKEATG